jgi:ACR3 family arsenite transporter
LIIAAPLIIALLAVPVMLFAVRIVNQSRGWYESCAGVVAYEECCS